MFNLQIKSTELKNANLNKKDLDIVIYAVEHDLVARLNDNRKAICEGSINGIYHALKSQGREDLNELIEYESLAHSPFEIR